MVSPYFPPDTSAGTHRVRLLAPHLPAFGWEPTVLTVDPEAYEGRLDPDLARLVPASLRVLRTDAWPASVTRRVGIGDLGLRALAGLRRAAKELLSRERFDALFITLYPTYPAVLGPGLKRRFGVPFVLDYQDPWVGAWGHHVGGGANSTADLKSRITRAIGERLEPRVVRQADALTAVSARTYEDVLARVPDARPRACASIPLGFEEQDLEALRGAPRSNDCFDPRDGLVHVCYVGTVLPTGGEVLSSTLGAVRQLRDQAPAIYQRLRLHFLGSSNQRDPAAVARVLPIAQELVSPTSFERCRHGSTTSMRSTSRWMPRRSCSWEAPSPTTPRAGFFRRSSPAGRSSRCTTRRAACSTCCARPESMPA